MVIRDLHSFRTVIGPYETNSILSIDPYAVSKVTISKLSYRDHPYPLRGEKISDAINNGNRAIAKTSALIALYPRVRQIQTACRGEGEASTHHSPLPPCFG
jgi:hypothetical protein